MLKKVMFVFGTRPEAIKMAPVVLELQKFPQIFDTIICVTGQHREMLDQVLNLFDIKPHFDLNIMKKGQDLYDVTSSVLLGLRNIFADVKPDIVLVHGDTTTSTASALAAFYQRIPVGHVEAGLRTFQMYSPWPEEINRQLTARLASFHFAPTILSKENLIKENINDNNIFVTGNTVIDALHLVANKIKNNVNNLEREIQINLNSLGYDISKLEKFNKKLILITGHRRENFGDGFINVCRAIKTLSEKFPNVDFVYPMHLNPNVRAPINEIFAQNLNANLFFIEPLEYLPFVYLMEKSYLILTDSGGIQEEAPGLGKPVLVMRDTTERPEAVLAGTVKIVGTDYEKLVNNVSTLITDTDMYNEMSESVNPYGDGKASIKIREILANV